MLEAEVQNVVENIANIANQAGLNTVDTLQQLLEKELEKKVTGSISVRFLLDGGFEGDLKLDIKSVQVRVDKTS